MICRECSRTFEPRQAHFHTCPACWRQQRASPIARLAQRWRQLSIYDDLGAEPVPVEFSSYLTYEDERDRLRDAA